ncbi:MAG: hypothetical protein HOM52_11660 [Rhodospirillaceae bacterium]|nr:hypothetical protein [Rhodospirillaceae bacterium]MBT3629072.1 hypothetical protein [Rhodospirillaceae bacterium]MBT3925633.1 hypothetical protein [Rhodospirillaceae bacterium]MBT4425907.1 hypothetical protein [Rhodospirillaceae bacterium]MBT5039159.1 hypothetical protein [Rhodospirillaceae bacterium]
MPNLESSDNLSGATAVKIGEALAYLSREAEAAGLETLATEICSAEEIAYEAAKHCSYLNA